MNDKKTFAVAAIGAMADCFESLLSSWSVSGYAHERLLHKSEEGEAFADKNPDFINRSDRKCFAPTANN